MHYSQQQTSAYISPNIKNKDVFIQPNDFKVATKIKTAQNRFEILTNEIFDPVFEHTYSQVC